MFLQSLSDSSRVVAICAIADSFKTKLLLCDLSDADYLSSSTGRFLEECSRRDVGDMLHDLGGLASAW